MHRSAPGVCLSVVLQFLLVRIHHPLFLVAHEEHTVPYNNKGSELRLTTRAKNSTDARPSDEDIEVVSQGSSSKVGRQTATNQRLFRDRANPHTITYKHNSVEVPEHRARTSIARHNATSRLHPRLHTGSSSTLEPQHALRLPRQITAEALLARGNGHLSVLIYSHLYFIWR